MASLADDRVAQQIAEASHRREASRRRRAALDAARQRGLAQRHAAKLRRLAERGEQAEPSTVVENPDEPEADAPVEAPEDPTTAVTAVVADPPKGAANTNEPPAQADPWAAT